MIPDDIDQQQKAQQLEGAENRRIEGFTDGSYGYPLQIKYMHNLTYIEGYAIGICQWKDELERRERENFEQAGMEF